MSAGTKPVLAKGQRKEPRIPGCKPVTVLGRDVYGNSFAQNTFTVEISGTGARLQGLPPVELGATLSLETDLGHARYRVVWLGEKNSRLEGHIGLECIESEKAIFGIAPLNDTSFYDEYKRVEAELHRSEDRYRNLFENSLGLICTHDMDGILLSLNPAAANALGYDSDRGVGRNLAEFLAPSVRCKFSEYLERMRQYGHDSGCMLVVARNKTKHVWMYRNLLVCEKSDAPYVVGHATDITGQKKVEHELRATLTRLRQTAAELKTLKGLLPICAWCKRIRNEGGDWTDLESYITQHSDANFSHGVCPNCASKLRSQPDSRLTI